MDARDLSFNDNTVQYISKQSVSVLILKLSNLRSFCAHTFLSRELWRCCGTAAHWSIPAAQQHSSTALVVIFHITHSDSSPLHLRLLPLWISNDLLYRQDSIWVHWLTLNSKVNSSLRQPRFVVRSMSTSFPTKSTSFSTREDFDYQHACNVTKMTTPTVSNGDQIRPTF